MLATKSNSQNTLKPHSHGDSRPLLARANSTIFFLRSSLQSLRLPSRSPVDPSSHSAAAAARRPNPPPPPLEHDGANGGWRRLRLRAVQDQQERGLLLLSPFLRHGQSPPCSPWYFSLNLFKFCLLFWGKFAFWLLRCQILGKMCFLCCLC